MIFQWNSVVWSMCWREGMSSRGTMTGLRGGPVQKSWNSTRPSARTHTWVEAIPSTNTGWAKYGLRAALTRRTWECWLMRGLAWPGNVHSQPRKPTISWAVSHAAWPGGWGRGFCPSVLLWWDPTCSPASSSGAFSTEKTWTCCSRSRGGHKKDPRAGAPLLWGQAERVGAVWPRRREGCGETLLQPSSTWRGGYKSAGEGLSTRARSDGTSGNIFKLKEGRFRLSIRKKFSPMRVVRPWLRLPREAVAVPSLQCSRLG